MERPIGRKHRDLASIDHHPRPHLSLAGHFNNVSMLNEGIEVQFDGFRLLSFGNDGEAVLLALHRYFPGRIVGLYGPVVSSFTQACNRNIGGIYLPVN